MIYESPKELEERIALFSGRKTKTTPRIFEDTSSYMNIVSGSVVRIGGNDYYIVTDARENRFGMDDQPKFWVKYAIDLLNGDRKVIKLVFHEEFITRVGPIKIRCRRSPKKESAILGMVRGDPRFMQGVTVRDPAGNLVRIIDNMAGRSLYHHIADMDMDHEQYFHETLPSIMQEVIGCVESLALLHRGGQHHGDVRTDHIWIEHQKSRFTWIDFDYEVSHTDYDLWSTGNLLIRVAGKGVHKLRDLHLRPGDYALKNSAVTPEDAALLHQDRIANLKKLFPYIPTDLNDILMRFSAGSTAFYPDLETLVRDLKDACPVPG